MSAGVIANKKQFLVQHTKFSREIVRQYSKQMGLSPTVLYIPTTLTY